MPSQAWTVDLLNGTLGSNGKAGTRPAWPVSGPDLVVPALTLVQGNITSNVVTQTISGTVEAGATVTVAINGGAPVDAAVTGTDWTFSTGALANGVNNVTVTAADFSENLFSAPPITITVDTLAPALVISQLATATNRPSQSIGGPVEAGATMAVTINGATAPVSVLGANWSATIGLIPGANSLVVTATDVLLNVATQSATITFIIPDGLISTGVGPVQIGDALKALRISVNLDTPTTDQLLRGDVAPLGAPNGLIDISDALLILRKLVGLPSF